MLNIFDEDGQFYIVADDKFYAMKQGLPNEVTYEQKIAWTENKADATRFSAEEVDLYYKRFKEELPERRIDVKEAPAITTTPEQDAHNSNPQTKDVL